MDDDLFDVEDPQELPKKVNCLDGPYLTDDIIISEPRPRTNALDRSRNPRTFHRVHTASGDISPATSSVHIDFRPSCPAQGSDSDIYCLSQCNTPMADDLSEEEDLHGISTTTAERPYFIDDSIIPEPRPRANALDRSRTLRPHPFHRVRTVSGDIFPAASSVHIDFRPSSPAQDSDSGIYCLSQCNTPMADDLSKEEELHGISTTTAERPYFIDDSIIPEPRPRANALDRSRTPCPLHSIRIAT